MVLERHLETENYDESDDVGIGVVILNSAGKVMAALSEKTQEPPSVM